CTGPYSSPDPQAQAPRRRIPRYRERQCGDPGHIFPRTRDAKAHNRIAGPTYLASAPDEPSMYFS
ncbi:MAG: hypothetical protein ACRDOD_21205, partial [Streptosporangiaceae bacterium]